MELKHFKFWCQKVLPLVYDDSLSYYEVLCKVIDYINNLINDNKIVENEIEDLKNEISCVKEWINNFDTKYVEKIIREYLATMIFVEITESGYFVYYIPDNWGNITFNTSGWDISIPDIQFGRLILSY